MPIQVEVWMLMLEVLVWWLELQVADRAVSLLLYYSARIHIMGQASHERTITQAAI